MKIAIVGSEDKHWTHHQKADAVLKIRELLDNISLHVGTINMVMVSGGCPNGGVDIWAEAVADSLDIKKEIHYPEVNQWDDKIEFDDSRINPPEVEKGFKSRNIEIAESCDVLYSIDPVGRKWSGGIWTLKYASGIGKEVHQVLI